MRAAIGKILPALSAHPLAVHALCRPPVQPAQPTMPPVTHARWVRGTPLPPPVVQSTDAMLSPFGDALCRRRKARVTTSCRWTRSFGWCRHCLGPATAKLSIARKLIRSYFTQPPPRFRRAHSPVWRGRCPHAPSLLASPPLLPDGTRFAPKNPSDMRRRLKHLRIVASEAEGRGRNEFRDAMQTVEEDFVKEVGAAAAAAHAQTPLPT